ncbi:SMP-30/gluconolactonase/LRE family protein [Marinoscillum furvescens]|nr:SMP-30/gluconolactonase/LRE family protein [Marinoscillum furvescens]
MEANQLESQVFITAEMELGEGPLWHPVESCWYWVDIYQGKLHKADAAGNHLSSFAFDKKLGFALPASEEQFVCGLEDGLAVFSMSTGKTSYLANINHEANGNRFNDGKTDPTGRVWGGTMNVDESTRYGNLYTWEHQKLRSHLSQLGVSNGLGWSPDHRTFYHIDSPRRTITAYGFDAVSGSLEEASNVIHVPESMGFPDGMAVDNEGMLWVAHWDGYAVRCWDPESGKVLHEIQVPAPRVTSCAFGGADGKTLLITTARTGLSKEELMKYPQSGSLFVAHLNVGGMPCTLAKH